MSRRYQVKFVRPDNGKTVYGVVESFSDEAKAAAKRGMAIVADAVTPESYEVPDSELTDVPLPDYSNPIGRTEDGAPIWGEYDQHVQEQFVLARKINDALPNGVHVGALFKIGVADGYAWYVVTKVNKTTCRVEWRGFGGGDRYTDHHFQWGGSFPVSDVARYVQRQRAIHRMFRKQLDFRAMEGG